MPVPGCADGEVEKVHLDAQKWNDPTVWLKHLANAERLILFGGRSTVNYLIEAVERFRGRKTRATDNFRVMTALGNAAVAAALGAEHIFEPRPPAEAEWLLQFGLASVRSIYGGQKAVVYEPLVWRAILVVVLEQHTVAFEYLLSTTMKLAYAASASALGFMYELT